jgi:hypothetical protein
MSAYAFFFHPTRFRWVDDEGFMLMTIREYVSGRPLYDGMYTEYGPFFYATIGGLFSLFGWKVTHDAGRRLANRRARSIWNLTPVTLRRKRSWRHQGNGMIRRARLSGAMTPKTEGLSRVTYSQQLGAAGLISGLARRIRVYGTSLDDIKRELKLAGALPLRQVAHRGDPVDYSSA